MQAIIDTIASWFNYTGLLIGELFDAVVISMFGLVGLMFVAVKDLLKWCIEWLWDASLDWTAESLELMLDKLGIFDDVNVEEIREWLELVNVFIPVQETLAWLEAYWVWRMAKYAFNAVRWMNPFK